MVAVAGARGGAAEQGAALRRAAVSDRDRHAGDGGVAQRLALVHAVHLHGLDGAPARAGDFGVLIPARTTLM